MVHIASEYDGRALESLIITDHIKEAIIKNNHKFAKEYEAINSWINHCSDQIINLKGEVKDLKELVHLQKMIINRCHDWTATLKDTVEELVASVQKLEGSIC